MTKAELNNIMKTLNDCWGGYGATVYDSWFHALEKYPYPRVSEAVWGLVETLKTKPRIADIMEAMGRDTVGGGSGQVEDNGCEMCASGWVMMETEPKMMAAMRCMCDLGERLNPKFAMITPEHIKARRWNIRGELKYFTGPDVDRENKLGKLNTAETIAWCKRGMAQMGKRW